MYLLDTEYGIFSFSISKFYQAKDGSITYAALHEPDKLTLLCQLLDPFSEGKLRHEKRTRHFSQLIPLNETQQKNIPCVWLFPVQDLKEAEYILSSYIKAWEQLEENNMDELRIKENQEINIEETKSERFVRLAEGRINKVIKTFRI